MTRSICTSSMVKDFLDDMAMISAFHGVYLEGDVVRRITPSDQSHRFSGYVARGLLWWRMGMVGVRGKSGSDRSARPSRPKFGCFPVLRASAPYGRRLSLAVAGFFSPSGKLTGTKESVR
jgi:hypothetical protein